MDAGTLTGSIDIVAIAGPMGVGKTLVSRELADRLGWARASFGDFVRAEAARRGLQTNRSDLQRLGQELVQSPATLVSDVVGSVERLPGQGIVLDGVRHRSVAEALRRLPDRGFALFYLDAPRAVLLRRWVARGGTESEFDAAERHPVETELPVVREGSDWVVDATSSAEAVVDAILERLRERRVSGP